MANLYANICQVGASHDMAECFAMITERSARLLGLENYGVALGNAADLVVLDAPDGATAVAEIAPPLRAFKAGRETFCRTPAALIRPGEAKVTQ
jgi:cytosine deaminase